jgi:multiple sugar transport system ATP-binding protein
VASVTYDKASRDFGTVVAVSELSLEIADGEFMVLVGPSGSGKTTALRLLAGLEPLTGGHIRIGDRVVDRLPPRDRDIAMVFQDYALYPQMSVRQNLAFGLRIRKLSRDEIARRVERAAELLEIGTLLDRKPRELSGGQRQRVALGRAIVREPQAFLMDEPLSNLDAQLRTQTRGEIKRLQREVGTTTVYVTHDQVEAMTMGDRIAVMSEGVLQQVGTPPELYMRPVNKFVAAFIGSPAMNFANVHADQGKLKMGNNLLHLTGSRAKVAQERHGRQLEIGFRPEDLEIANGTGDGAVRFPAKVDVVEYLGNQELLHAEVEGNEILALVASDRNVQVGDNVEFTIPSDKLHLFDPETQESLVPTG